LQKSVTGHSKIWSETKSLKISWEKPKLHPKWEARRIPYGLSKHYMEPLQRLSQCFKKSAIPEILWK
jgi:hypothetical protein